PSSTIRSPMPAKIQSSVSCPRAGTATGGSSCQYRDNCLARSESAGSAGVPFPALALDCGSAGVVVPVQDSCWDETERSSLQRRLLARDNHEVIARPAAFQIPGNCHGANTLVLQGPLQALTSVLANCFLDVCYDV